MNRAGFTRLLAALTAVALATGASGNGTHTPPSGRWTTSSIRAFVLTPGRIHATDRLQADAPSYTLRFTPVRALRVTPLGHATLDRGVRKWQRFAVAGPAQDMITGERLTAAFTLRRPTAATYNVAGFHAPPPDNSQPSFPIRATAFYAWFPEGWTQQGIYPFTRYRPSLGYYDSGDPAVIQRQIESMLYAHIQAGLYSWWRPGTGNDSAQRFPRMLRIARATPFRWAIYYEEEGQSDPSVDEINADLVHIRDAYATKPAYLKVNGRFVVYVYAAGNDGCGMADRWKQANTVNAYVVLKAFGGYRDCASQPDSWHEYSVGLDEYSIPPANDYVGPLQSFMISPGFNARDTRAPTQPRDLQRWRRNIQDMVSSGALWQLVLTFNEWNEGTAVESGTDWATPSGYGAYLDALHEAP